MCWIAANYMREGHPAWLALGRRAVERLQEVSVPYKDGAWVHPGFHNGPPDEGCLSPESARFKPETIADLRKADPCEVCQGWNATGMSWTLQGLCRCYEATGDKNALVLAGKFARYLKDYAQIIAPDGRFLAAVPIAPDGDGSADLVP